MYAQRLALYALILYTMHIFVTGSHFTVCRTSSHKPSPVTGDDGSSLNSQVVYYHRAMTESAALYSLTPPSPSPTRRSHDAQGVALYIIIL